MTAWGFCVDQITLIEQAKGRRRERQRLDARLREVIEQLAKGSAADHSTIAVASASLRECVAAGADPNVAVLREHPKGMVRGVNLLMTHLRHLPLAQALVDMGAEFDDDSVRQLAQLAVRGQDNPSGVSSHILPASEAFIALAERMVQSPGLDWNQLVEDDHQFFGMGLMDDDWEYPRWQAWQLVQRHYSGFSQILESAYVARGDVRPHAMPPIDITPAQATQQLISILAQRNTDECISRDERQRRAVAWLEAGANPNAKLAPRMRGRCTIMQLLAEDADPALVGLCLEKGGRVDNKLIDTMVSQCVIALHPDNHQAHESKLRASSMADIEALRSRQVDAFMRVVVAGDRHKQVNMRRVVCVGGTGMLGEDAIEGPIEDLLDACLPHFKTRLAAHRNGVSLDRGTPDVPSQSHTRESSPRGRRL